MDTGDGSKGSADFDLAEAFSERAIKRRLQVPSVQIRLRPCPAGLWSLFKQHSPSTKLSSGARCFVATWNGVPVSFVAIRQSSSPSSSFTESRNVVLPDFQGLGIGSRCSDAVGQMLINEQRRSATY